MSNEQNCTQIEAYVNEAHAETYIKQVFINSSNNPVELSFDLPNQKGIQFVDFEVEIKDKKVKSKLITKEKAEEKYSDAIASGNTGIYSEYNKNLDKYVIHLGNIEPNTKVNFKSHFLQSLISNNLNYLFRLISQFPFPTKNISLFNNSNNNSNPIKIKITFESSSPITSIEQKINAKNPIIKSRFNSDKTRYDIEMSLKEQQNYKTNNSIFSFLFDNASYQNNLPLVSFEFQIEEYKKPKLYKQFDPKNNETTFLLSYFKTILDPEKINYNQNDLIKSFPGLYYFIIDQSGSMSGRPINLVIQTLKVFMQSLSKGSYYQLIGFGSSYKAYSTIPLAYTKENVNDTLNQIEYLKGDMGGTELFEPLNYVYNSKNNDNLHLPQHIFILTDGYTLYKEKTLDIIDKNNSKYQVYAYGIGNDFDQDFIRTAGEVGFGSYKFINNIDNLSVIINEQLNKCMRQYYDKVKFNVEKINDNSINNSDLIYDFYRNEFILENQLVNYSFLMKGKIDGNIEIKNSYNQGEKQFNEFYRFNENQIYTLKDGDILAKITIHSLIQKGEGEDFSQEDKVKKIAKKYQVLCEYTSLFAEVENSQANKEGNVQPYSNNLQIRETKNEFYQNNYNNIQNMNFNNYNNYNNQNNNYNNYNNYNNNYNNQNNNYNNYNNYNNNLFSNQMNYSKSKGLFGNQNNFNNNQNYNQQMLFGNNNNLSNQNSLFDSFNINNDSFNNYNCQKSIFNNYNNNQIQTSSLFGSNYNNSGNVSLFGNLYNNNKSASIFNNNKQQSTLFGNSSNSKNKLEKNINFYENKKENINNQDNVFSSLFNNTNNNNEKKNESNIDKSKILENIIMSLDIIDGYWEENQYTKYIIDMKLDIFNKVQKLVNNDKIAVTFIILYYIINDRKDKIAEYSNIINKAKNYLINCGWSYDNLVSRI